MAEDGGRYTSRSFGQAWLDRHVHLYVAAGAPLLGAPAAARATLLGDRMGLEAFLTMPEATLMARSFSSSPWLFPIGERASTTFYLRRQSLLEVRDFVACLEGLGVESNKNRIVLAVEIDMGPGFAAESLTTKSSVTFEDQTATFDPGSNLMFFGCPADLPEDASIRVIVKEKGLHDDSVVNPLKRLSKGLVAAVQLASEAAHGRSGRGVPKASTTVRRLGELLRVEPDADGFVQASLQLAKLHAFGPQTATKGDGWLKGCVKFRVRWRDPKALRLAWLGSQGLDQFTPSSSAGEGGFQLRHNLRSRAAYDSVSHLELLQMEGSATPAGVKCPDVMKVWRKYYERDSAYNHNGADDCPPVRNMLAVHGVNVPTEVGYALRINTVRAKPSMFNTRFVLDDEAELVAPKKGIEMKGGTISEVAGGASPSGDGTVPLHSLEHSEAWRGQLRLKSVRLESVAHRDMLADPQFHEALHDVLWPMGGFLDRWQSSTNGHEWFDFPAAASSQLEAARTAGKDSIELSINKYTYHVDLKALVQRNVSTGRERQVRRLLVPAGELCEASELVVTPYRGWPDGGFEREAVVAEGCSEAEACSCARRAVREDPANCVAEVVFRVSLTGGRWLAKAFTSGPEQCMTFARGHGRGYMVYSSEARSKPPAA
ncbi:unnamed protein product [Prorocentrum cordatum]|uniref:WWE domain-containing protein n=1 Tax=Prorocentrum cordatum TaxID=2364126 RepID=A0ABN9V380_9DINO|nr:unnamed protein product [Polarella glacialis]